MNRKAESPEEKEYWAFIDKTAKRVEGYPDWKRGGKTVILNSDEEEKSTNCKSTSSDIPLSLK